MTSSQKRGPDLMRFRAGIAGFVSRRRANWVWYDTHLPVSRGGHLFVRFVRSTGNLSVESRGNS